MKKTIGHAPCPLCKSGPHPVKVSDTGNLYMVCPPPADGGCKSQIFARDPASNRVLAQSITKWSIPKEERAEWLGDEPQPTEHELEEQLEEALDEGELEVEPAAPPPPAPSQARPTRSAPKSTSSRAQPTPPAKPKRPQPPQLAKAKPKKFFGGLIEW